MLELMIMPFFILCLLWAVDLGFSNTTASFATDGRSACSRVILILDQVKAAAGRTLSPITTSLVLRIDVLFDIYITQYGSFRANKRPVYIAW